MQQQQQNPSLEVLINKALEGQHSVTDIILTFKKEIISLTQLAIERDKKIEGLEQELLTAVDALAEQQTIAPI